MRCSIEGTCVPLVKASRGQDGYALGLKIDRGSDTLWTTNNAPGGASLRRYDIRTGKLLEAAHIEGKHVFNDLALSSTGTVYVSDTSEGSVYQLNSRTNTLRRMAPEHAFTAANGIAISPDGNMLYVSAWGDGIDLVDLRSGLVKPMMHADNICLGFIDGLYAAERSLIAIQNGPMLPRIVRFGLSDNEEEIVGMTILERRNPAFDAITTGALVGNEFYYVANPQIDKKDKAALQPLRVLAVQVAP